MLFTDGKMKVLLAIIIITFIVVCAYDRLFVPFHLIGFTIIILAANSEELKSS